MDLNDQFDDAMDHRVEHVRDFVPAYFCVPVSKEVGEKPWTPILDRETHFTIYTIESNATYNKPVWTRDQFKAQQLRVGKAQFLGVPSRKYLVNP